ncbi:MAG: protein translocase subunit [Alyxoria varia]|nr:MAG: protein translocase subunit [Alyxoria varia]
MSALRSTFASLRATKVAARSFATAPSGYGRSPAYRRIVETRARPSFHHGSIASLSPRNHFLLLFETSSSPKSSISFSSKPTSVSSRQFHAYSQIWQESQHKEDVKDPPREGDPASSSSGEKNSNSERASSADDNGQEKEKRDDQSQNKQEEDGEKKDKEEAPPPPPHGDKSPWEVFTDTLRSEFKASKEWNEGTKALASSAQDFTQNETLQKMRAGYGVASDAATSTTAKVLKSTGSAVGKSAAWTWDTTPVKGLRIGASATGRGVEKITRPLRETETFKSVRDVIDDGSSSRYGGWAEKEERRKKRESREQREATKSGRPRQQEKMDEDPNAGTNVTLHKDAAWKESWRNFRDSSKVVQGLFNLKSTYTESENPLISTARSISDRVAGFFAENETATVIKAFRAMDPSFQLEPFLQDMREYILPEVLDAYVKGDTETLKLWLSAAQYQVYAALTHQYATAGLKLDGRIVDIRNVDILNARMLENEIPVFIITARTQEVHVYRNAKTNELSAGMEDRVQQVTYAIGVTRIPEDVSNPETRGWRLIELQKSSRNYM